MRRFLALLLAMLFAWPAEGSAPKAKWGEITYPLFGNACSEEGTLLVWFRVEEPLPGKTGEWYQPRRSWFRFIVATMTVNEHSRLTLFWKPGRGRGAMWTGVHLSTFPRGTPNLTGGGAKWKAGEARFVAYTWDRAGRHTWLPDGKERDHMVSTAVENGIGSIDEERAALTLGSRRRDSALTIYGVHILDKALTQDDLAKPAADLFRARDATLLLDGFDNEDFVPDGKRQTRAEVITGFCGERGGVPSDACRFVETPQGRGLRLYTPPRGVDLEGVIRGVPAE